MRAALVYELPSFDTGLFSATEFLMSGGNAQLLIKVAEQSNIVLKFQRVRWHEFTAVYNCSTDQIQTPAGTQLPPPVGGSNSSTLMP